MLSGNECPVCGENIGIWAVFRAPLPNRIYCPHCGERLRYGDTTLTILAAVRFFDCRGRDNHGLACLRSSSARMTRPLLASNLAGSTFIAAG